jgi:lauroyl/myristoyl acyltransferase
MAMTLQEGGEAPEPNGSSIIKADENNMHSMLLFSLGSDHCAKRPIDKAKGNILNIINLYLDSVQFPSIGAFRRERGEIPKMTLPPFENIWMGFKYFFLLPLMGLFPPPLPYFFSRSISRLECRYHAERKELARQGMTQFLPGASVSAEATEEVLRRYFEVLFCDDIDAFIYLFGFSKWFLKRVRIEGEEYLKGALRQKGGVLMSCHFGGGFWVLPFLRARGFKVRFFSADIKKEDYPDRKVLYYYLRLRSWAVERASGEGILFRKKGRQGLTQSLQEGAWVLVLLDVPPHLVQEKAEVSFLGRRAWFPKGIFSIAKETKVSVLPFFSFLERRGYRRIVFERPMEVVDEVESLNESVAMLEKRVRERPDHWHFWPIAHQFFIPMDKDKEPSLQ